MTENICAEHLELWSCMLRWGQGCTKCLSPGWAHSCSVAAAMEHWGGQKSTQNSSDHKWVTLSPPEIQKLQQESTCSSECCRETTYMVRGNQGKLLTSHLCHCFGKADQSCQLLCWELKRNREGWRKWRTSLHWHWSTVLWDQCDSPSQVFLRSLVLLRWSLLTSGQQGWMAPCFPMYQLLDTAPCALSAWWYRTS